MEKQLVSQFDLLPENLQQEVLDYIEFLVKKYVNPLKIKEETTISVKKLDPFAHSRPIQYDMTEDLTHVKPFAHVKNSAEYGKELREKAWDRR
ncbi:MAG TPA: DUF2281 domain-containing protein [Thiotrichaceae bacterium]|nr:DUF2281 domain-containing protein [Thiotrichaceae bacterium]